jgi:hypothetical protein
LRAAMVTLCTVFANPRRIAPISHAPISHA